MRSIRHSNPINQIIILHLKRSDLFDWVRTLLAITIGTQRELPPIILQKESKIGFDMLSNYFK